MKSDSWSYVMINPRIKLQEERLEMGMQPGDLVLLEYLLSEWKLGQPGIARTVSELAREKGITQSGASKKIGRLRKAGLVRLLHERETGTRWVVINPTYARRGAEQVQDRQKAFWAQAGGQAA